MRIGLLSLFYEYSFGMAAVLMIMMVVVLIIAISIHEYAHAKAADLLGDDTARLLGRVTLDPRAHLDPLGSIMLLIAGFGWGKPVPFNPINLKNPKRDSAIIALAGPMSNFILGGIFALIINVANFGVVMEGFMYLVVFYNVLLGVFNLIPVYPLDGQKIVAGLLPPNLYMQWMQMSQYGIYILLFLIVTDATDVIITPLINFFMNLYGL